MYIYIYIYISHLSGLKHTLLSSLNNFTSHSNLRPTVHTSLDNKNSVNLHT
jgi:hypothetical protein